MARDWIKWHEEYEVPGSSLARRLEVVRGYLQPLLDRPRRVISMCAGDGRDVLPLLPEGSTAVLVEWDPVLAERARGSAPEGVTVVTGDAGVTDPYAPAAPAEIVLACGVFGNIPYADTRRTIQAMPSLLAPGGTVIWTRAGDSPVRDEFAANGFEELAYCAPTDARFRVGMHRLTRPPSPFVPGERLFTFV
ncbi:methyltransferase domain-containing protein [Actinoplanes sp. LDG1-06]|uniref:Methyltransferase domain-containing protein n=1 Tax=Paractinoplanes ovalisporus TaxID=2810368 RepID=A0ABS2ATS3_9ACTN|nr:methyltransferase domain-containing protein [Actinoplanes ovalisporus]MBM2623206.1 methyltransferase domain-containing protein [Actinoplanes ovalisporus]